MTGQKKGIFGLLTLLIALILSGCSEPEPTITFFADDKNYEFTAEIVNTPELRQQGLMFRESLSDEHGMLFIFETANTYGFWMKNTLIPLDIIYIAENETIVDIATLEPCTQDPCPTYIPTAPARYVFEINAGLSDQLGIEIGDKVGLPQTDSRDPASHFAP